MEPRSSRRGLLIFLLASLLVLAAVPPGRAAEPFEASLSFAVTPDAYQNMVRVAPPDALDWPRIVVDRSPDSPYYGYVYVLGTKETLKDNALWSALVVARSPDGGRSFETPWLVEPFRNVSFSSVVNIVDVVTDRNGSLYLAFGGSGILRSIDGGVSWQFFRIFGDFRYVTAVSVDPASGTVYAVAGNTTTVGAPPELFVMSSDDQGVTWSAPSRIVLSGVTYVADPRIAALSESLVVGYLAPVNVSGNWKSAVASYVSADRGVTWSSTVVRASASREMHSLRIETSPDGVLGFAWRETWTEPTNGNVSVQQSGIYAALSSDGAATFSSPVEVVVGAYDLYAPEVAFTLDNRSRTYAAWSVPPQNLTDYGSLYAAGSNAAATGFDAASFKTSLQSRDGYLTAQEDLAAGPNGTVYLAWSSLNWSDPANFTVDNETSGIFLRTVSGAAEGAVTDESGLFVNTAAAVEFRDPIAGGSTSRIPFNGSAIVLDEIAPNAYDVWIVSGLGDRRAGSLPVQAWGRTTFTVRIELAGANLRGSSPWFVAAAIVAGLVLLGAILASLQHTRITRANVFQNKLRLLIYEYVKENPGAPFGQIRGTFGLHNGVAAHHLAVLERQGFLHSETKGRHRWFYSDGNVSLWKDLPLSPLQSSILEAVRATPGIGVRELSRTMDRRASSVGDNVKALVREGLLRTEREGRMLRCFPGDAGDAGPGTQ